MGCDVLRRKKVTPADFRQRALEAYNLLLGCCPLLVTSTVHALVPPLA